METRCEFQIGSATDCGILLRASSDAPDDVAYRLYASRVLRGMENQLSFHVMRPLDSSDDKQVPIGPE
ncbi:hypothetical protein PHYSODRAFT_326968 [Phytophthora sojae]|uniref:Uncharacterized protein n=1 Tax=Phytophthora sojae (strain P6497) TaxID=1094619 RepID=G4YUV1_PHYSP|nr:hypothetical protein PHYSODRAFT_326968 [Phytophthora sojae]EGZ26026.1 hypothetical protein PHYSODRAFT_326968 [Phytophthora sojae]|eukprot:XP_009521314.1 hypothetical protein PHYSODRAFT_326968 [Phytophthora sojae]